MSENSMKTDRQPSPETVAEAAAWITRLHGSKRSPEVEAGLRHWLAADEKNARAFECMTEIWEGVPAMRTGQLSRVPDLERPPHAGWRYWAIAASVLAVTAITGVAGYVAWRADQYATDIGEQRIVNLDDGTRVSLNSGTQVAVRYEAAERRIVLKSGEAFFEVARQPGRPFTVMAGDHEVTAIGTSFAVRYDGVNTAVSLVEGKVSVASGKDNWPTPVMLVTGQRLTFEKSKAVAPKLDQPRMEAVTAWRRGEVILDETVLADAIAEMNRYDKIALMIDTPAIAALPVSGIYRTGDSPGFARIVAEMYGLQVVEKDGQIHLRR